jgi:hypothetical protein
VFDAPDVLPLDGKPVKSEDKIRSVLKAVAASQDHRPAPGTFKAAQIAHDWFIVAITSSNLDVWSCQRLLLFVGIECRLRHLGRDTALEVPAPFRNAAIDVLDQHRDRLRLSRKRAQRFGKRVVVSLAILTIAISFAFLVPLLLVMLLLSSGMPGGPIISRPQIFWEYYLASPDWLIALSVAFLLELIVFYFVGIHKRKARKSRADSAPTGI